MVVVREFEQFWAVVYSSSSGAYLELADLRWQYPLLPLGRGVLEKIVEAEPDLLQAAFRAIQTVDYKTVSIVEFERILLAAPKVDG